MEPTPDPINDITSNGASPPQNGNGYGIDISSRSREELVQLVALYKKRAEDTGRTIQRLEQDRRTKNAEFQALEDQFKARGTAMTTLRENVASATAALTTARSEAVNLRKETEALKEFIAKQRPERLAELEGKLGRLRDELEEVRRESGARLVRITELETAVANEERAKLEALKRPTDEQLKTEVQKATDARSKRIKDLEQEIAHLREEAREVANLRTQVFELRKAGERVEELVKIRTELEQRLRQTGITLRDTKNELEQVRRNAHLDTEALKSELAEQLKQNERDRVASQETISLIKQRASEQLREIKTQNEQQIASLCKELEAAERRSRAPASSSPTQNDLASLRADINELRQAMQSGFTSLLTPTQNKATSTPTASTPVSTSVPTLSPSRETREQLTAILSTREKQLEHLRIEFADLHDASENQLIHNRRRLESLDGLLDKQRRSPDASKWRREKEEILEAQRALEAPMLHLRKQIEPLQAICEALRTRLNALAVLEEPLPEDLLIIPVATPIVESQHVKKVSTEDTAADSVTSPSVTSEAIPIAKTSVPPLSDPETVITSFETEARLLRLHPHAVLFVIALELLPGHKATLNAVMRAAKKAEWTKGSLPRHDHEVLTPNPAATKLGNWIRFEAMSMHGERVYKRVLKAQLPWKVSDFLIRAQCDAFLREYRA